MREARDQIFVPKGLTVQDLLQPSIFSHISAERRPKQDPLAGGDTAHRMRVVGPRSDPPVQQELPQPGLERPHRLDET